MNTNTFPTWSDTSTVAQAANPSRLRRFFGVVARPAGAFIIENGTVRWLPALDATRLIGAGVIVLLALTRRWHRRRRRLTSARPRG